MDLYAQNILDRYKTPFYKDKKIAPTHERIEANHTCGDTVDIKLSVAKSKVQDYSFAGAGCAISMASADILGDLVKDLSEDEVLAITKEDLYKALGIEISIRRSKCALLPLLAIQNALKEARKEPRLAWTDYHIDS